MHIFDQLNYMNNKNIVLNKYNRNDNKNVRYSFLLYLFKNTNDTLQARSFFTST